MWITSKIIVCHLALLVISTLGYEPRTADENYSHEQDNSKSIVKRKTFYAPHIVQALRESATYANPSADYSSSENDDSDSEDVSSSSLEEFDKEISETKIPHSDYSTMKPEATKSLDSQHYDTPDYVTYGDDYSSRETDTGDHRYTDEVSDNTDFGQEEDPIYHRIPTFDNPTIPRPGNSLARYKVVETIIGDTKYTTEKPAVKPVPVPPCFNPGTHVIYPAAPQMPAPAPISPPSLLAGHKFAAGDFPFPNPYPIIKYPDVVTYRSRPVFPLSSTRPRFPFGGPPGIYSEPCPGCGRRTRLHRFRVSPPRSYARFRFGQPLLDTRFERDFVTAVVELDHRRRTGEH